MTVVDTERIERLAAINPMVGHSMQRISAKLNRMADEELVEVIVAMDHALTPVSGAPHPVAAAIAGNRQWSHSERVNLEFEILARSFERRRALLEGALTTAQVARLLGTSRQTPHDRVDAGTLLAVLDRGGLRFPAWQFDSDSDNGVVKGLAEVVRALDVSPVAKVSWMTLEQSGLDGATPLHALRAGEIQRVVALARSVGTR